VLRQLRRVSGTTAFTHYLSKLSHIQEIQEMKDQCSITIEVDIPAPVRMKQPLASQNERVKYTSPLQNHTNEALFTF
jgi:hypothetical protein